MTATQTFQREDQLEIELEGVDLDTVHFTGDTFDGELVVRNLSDKQLTGTIEFANETERTFGSDQSLSTMQGEIDIEPCGTQREPVTGSVFFGGTGTEFLWGIKEPTVAESDEETVVVEPGDDFVALASMVFWDRDFYRVNHVWPRRAQYLSVVVAFLSAVLAGMIVWLSLG